MAGNKLVGKSVIAPAYADTIENTLVPVPEIRVSVTCAGAENPIDRALSGLRTTCTPSFQVRLPKA